MYYHSTRDNSITMKSKKAIYTGISPDGGLFVPESLPVYTSDDILRLAGLNYQGIATDILSKFLTDFTEEELQKCIAAAYADQFDSPAIAPLAKIDENTYLLELWHGPTCAFKDMALQLLPHLLTTGALTYGQGRKIVILVATSGDTGKAALEGFQDVAGTEIVVFYPRDGVSSMQKLQMATQQGTNVSVCAVKGNFDDAQNGVKDIFADGDFVKELEKKGMVLSSANSINWGRLVPQIVYYFAAYCQLVRSGSVKNGCVVNAAVPTGNFGNILAAYYAKKMGLPIGRLICASNTNHILTDFIKTGVYDRNRLFYATASPSMDILISSNLERLIYDLSGMDAPLVKTLFTNLKQQGRYEISAELKEKLGQIFYGAWCGDSDTLRTIRGFFEKYNYLCDTHTAVAVNAAEQYRLATGDTAPVVIASTASPYKFPENVLKALKDKEEITSDDFAVLREISSLSGMEIPHAISQLGSLKVLHGDSCKKDEMKEYLCRALKI